MTSEIARQQTWPAAGRPDRVDRVGHCDAWLRAVEPWLLISALLFLFGCSRAEPVDPQMTGGSSVGATADSDDGGPSVSQSPDGSAAETTDSAAATQESGRAEPGEEPSEPEPLVRQERLFDGWPDPQLVLFITGRQDGYLEPCGCTGLANQKGGLARRHTLAKQIAERGWPMVAVDVGNQVRRSGKQPELKFQVTINSLRRIGYAAVGLGPDDLRLSVDELGALTANTEDQPSLIVCANVAVYAPELMRRYHVAEAGGKKVGITAVLGKEHLGKLLSDFLVVQDPADALREVWPELEAKQCDLYVLLAHASLDETQQLARQFPQFQVVVTAGGAGEPPREPDRLPDSDTLMVQVGNKGMYVGVLGWFDDPQQPVRYQRVPLDARFADSPEMLALFKAYQEQLKQLGLEGLGLRPVAHPSGWQFVGSQKCGECHDREYTIWKEGVDGQGGPHSHATESLVYPGERSDIPRHYDPECLSCHVTGWNPQGYYPYRTGYLQLSDTWLHGNGCENCHGPGSQHVAAEEGTIDVDDAGLARLREAMRLTLEQARKSKCYECHDLDNSPDFQVEGAFEKYWAKIEH